MNRIHVLVVLGTLSAVIGCQQGTYTHDDDDYAVQFLSGWRCSIGTDFFAGNNEYLYFDNLAMEWSSDKPGSGYLYATEPKSDAVVWSFDGHPKDSRVVPVKDGTTQTCTHTSGVTYELKIVKQTKYYVKIFYQKKSGSDGKDVSD